MDFFETETHNITVIPKGLSSSIGKAIAERDCVEEIKRLTDSGEPMADFIYKAIVPHTETPSKPTAALMREPIERLLSALAMNNTNVQETIESLKSGEGWQATHPIFMPQNLESIDKVFRFPEQEEDFCKETGLPYPLPKLNQSKNTKPELTEEQQEFFEEYYATDIKLYQSL